MKYHQTASTIIISIMILLVILAVSLFVIIDRNLDSPSQVLLERVEAGLSLPDGYSFSYGSVDRYMTSGLRINNITVSRDGRSLVTADGITIYQNPLQLISMLLFGTGRFEVDFINTHVYIPQDMTGSSGGSSGSGPAMDTDRIMAIIQGLEGHTDQVEDQLFYSYAYSINSVGLTVELEGIGELADMRFNLSIDENLSFRSFSFSAPAVDVSLSGSIFKAEDIRFIATRNDVYRMRLSAELLSYESGENHFEVDGIASEIDFPSFASLDLRTTPVRLSFSSAEGSFGSSGFLIGPTSASTGDGQLLCSIQTLSGTFSGFSAATGRTDIMLSASRQLSLKTYDNINVESESGRVASVAPFTIAASFPADSGSLTVNLPELTLFSSSAAIDNYFSALSLTGFSVRMNEEEGRYSVVSGGRLSIASSIDVLNGVWTEFDVNAGFTSAEDLTLTLSADRIDFPELEDDMSAYLKIDNGNMDLEVSFIDQFSLIMNNQDGVNVDMTLFGLELGPLSPVIAGISPVFERYISDDTVASGSLSFNSNEGYGSLYGSLALSDIRFNNMSFGIASRVDAVFNPEEIRVDSLTLTSDIVRASYTGLLDRQTFMPEGAFEVSMTDSGRQLLLIDFSLGQAQEYSFDATIPFFSNSYFRGSVNWGREGVIISNGSLKAGETEYPFDLTVDLSNMRVDVLSEGLIFSLDYEKTLDLLVSFDSFALPHRSGEGATTLNGYVSGLFDFENQIITVEAPDFSISGIAFINPHPDVSFSLLYNQDGLVIEDILIDDGQSSMSGRAEYSPESSSLAMTIGGDTERINLSLMKIADGGYSGILELSELSLDGMGLEGMVLNSRLIGYGSSLLDFSFSGTLTAGSSADSDTAPVFNSDVIIDSTSLSFQNIRYRKGDLELTSPEFDLDVKRGSIAGNLSLSLDRQNADRLYPVKGEAELSLDIGTYDTIVEFSMAVPSMISEGLEGSIYVPYFTIDGRSVLKDDRIGVSVTGSRIGFEGGVLDGFYSFPDGEIDMSLALGTVAGLKASGYASASRLDLDLDDVYADLSVANFLYYFPIVYFEQGAYVNGDFYITGSLSDFHIYGNAYSRGFDLNVWWLDREYVRCGDLYISVVDNNFLSTNTPIMTIDRQTGEINNAYAVLEAQLSAANFLDYYSIDINVNGDNHVSLWIPLTSSNMQIRSLVSGHFNLYGTASRLDLSGDLTLDEGVFSIGLDELPYWWDKSETTVSNNFYFTLRDNCSFVMPLGADPIITANFTENTRFSFSNDPVSRRISVGGDLGFRSGEIYYFEKNFYITEGAISFNESSTGSLTPVISLRARLRDFDTAGNKVDIYLILNNTTLDNISPTFTSSPQKDTNEIMLILGESILPTSAYGDFNLGQVTSILSSSIDVMSRMGIINTSSNSFNLSQVIRRSLGLDMMSMRTSLVRNLLIDTIFTRSSQDYTPMARYLNDTSIYLGKYLSSNLFLQGLIHLEAVKNSSVSFLAPDLALDFEISLEWSTPLGEITFATTPAGFTLYDVFHSFALSYSKRIVF